MKSLLEDYLKFERIAKSQDKYSDTLNTSKVYFLGPTTLIPLLCFARQNRIQNIITHHNTLGYINRILQGDETSTTTPFTILPNTNEDMEKEQTAVIMANKIDSNTYGGYKTIFHICNELISNVYDHTPFEKGYAHNGYTYAQEYPHEKRLDICVMDDGLSIPGRFEKNGIEFVDDCDAIYKATNSVSTSKQGCGMLDSRGNGLWSTLKLVVEANKGNAIIVSRNGCLNI